jgi:GNAT superfamily N-acetyltransferase
MFQWIFRRLAESDVDAFIAMRIRQLREEGTRSTIDLTPQLREYYARHMADGRSLLGWRRTATQSWRPSGMSFVEKTPYYDNPSGRIGLLSSMYTRVEYRRQGIARALLDKVVGEARRYGCGAVQITASDMGVLLYTDYGFEKNHNFMQYALHNES